MPAPPPTVAQKPGGRLSSEEYDRLFRGFEANISSLDCGRFCAPLNGGEPVCCTTGAAVPVMDRAEWRLLSARTDIWSRFRPRDAAGREVVESLAEGCVAVECKGAAHCERGNRSLSCRAFPFAPYVDAGGAFVGASFYWGFADRCWVVSNLSMATPEYLRQFFAAYDALFARDLEEWRAHADNAAAMRRVFSRRGEPFALVDRRLDWHAVLPRGAGYRKMRDPAREIARHAPFRSAAEYRRAVAEAGGRVDEALVAAAFPPRPRMRASG